MLEKYSSQRNPRLLKILYVSASLFLSYTMQKANVYVQKINRYKNIKSDGHSKRYQRLLKTVSA